MRELAAGRFGDRAGDVMLLAEQASERPEERYYFGAPQSSGHGGPSREASEVPLVVAQHGRRSGDISAIVAATLGERPRQARVTDLVLRLRAGR